MAFVSWYRAPRDGSAIHYLARSPDDKPEEITFYYTPIVERAWRFETREAAVAATPVYDGSNNLDGRCGVLEVLEGCEIIDVDPWLKPTLIFVALATAYFVWQFFLR